jgi:predicted SAM-dependent methyltransferase
MVTIDLGCGNNKVSPYFIGVDSNKEPQVDYVLDAENLHPFADSSINAIVAKRSLNVFTDDVQALREMNRVLAKDGIVVIEVASLINASIAKLLNALGIKRYTYKTLHAYSQNKLKQIIKESGLKILRFGYANTKWGFRNYLVILTKMETN